MFARIAFVTTLALTTATLTIATGCSEEEYNRDAAANAEAGGDAEQTPAARAKANSDEGAAALAVSDKGKDEDGEKTWKQEAREYYDRAKNPRNRTFEMPGEWALKLTNSVYAAGAEKVWVTRIDETDLGGNIIYMSDDLLIVLPADPAKRKAVFEAYNKEVEDEELKFPDVGQKYIHIVAD